MSTLAKENIYGHMKRLHWIISRINKRDIIVEVGCGTGYMISLQLAKLGYTICGVDLHKKSIAFGKELFCRDGLDPGTLGVMDISELDVLADVIIASETLEHIPDSELGESLKTMCGRLKPGGRLLVTVPNGYGWFELESFVWFKCKIGWLLQFLKIARIIDIIKHLIFGPNLE